MRGRKKLLFFALASELMIAACCLSRAASCLTPPSPPTSVTGQQAGHLFTAPLLCLPMAFYAHDCSSRLLRLTVALERRGLFTLCGDACGPRLDFLL